MWAFTDTILGTVERAFLSAPMMTDEPAEVFRDEFGYTGDDLLNGDQPAFVLASTILSDDEPRELGIEKLRGRGRLDAALAAVEKSRAAEGRGY
jgi:hypothetical protein